MGQTNRVQTFQLINMISEVTYFKLYSGMNNDINISFIVLFLKKYKFDEMNYLTGLEQGRQS